MAVCWVCGEVVFRGDECVSLGWCFWHRSCYGCLMCGDRRIVEGSTLSEIFDERLREKEKEEVEHDGGRSAKEIDEIPLCSSCAEEVGRDRCSQTGEEAKSTVSHELTSMALERVDKFDGGLSRRRWEARQRHEQPQPHGACGSNTPAHHDAEDEARSPSPIYVSSRDPLGEESFRRSSTKPIPEWMRNLPSQRQYPEDVRSSRPTSLLDSYFEPPESTIVGLHREIEEKSASPSPVPSHVVPTGQPLQTYIPTHMSRPFTLIKEEPVQRPSSSKAADKHVHFTSSPLLAQGYLRDNHRHEMPSESSEFLERYNVQRSASKGSTRPDMSLVPWHSGHASADNFSQPDSESIETCNDSSKSKDCGSMSNDTDQCHHGHDFSSLGLISRRGVSRRLGTGVQIRPRRREFLRPPMGHLNGGGDGVLDCVGASLGMSSRRRPWTIQNQLKRVFGFS